MRFTDHTADTQTRPPIAARNYVRYRRVDPQTWEEVMGHTPCRNARRVGDSIMDLITLEDINLEYDIVENNDTGECIGAPSFITWFGENRTDPLTREPIAYSTLRTLFPEVYRWCKPNEMLFQVLNLDMQFNETHLLIENGVVNQSVAQAEFVLQRDIRNIPLTQVATMNIFYMDQPFDVNSSHYRKIMISADFDILDQGNDLDAMFICINPNLLSLGVLQ